MDLAKSKPARFLWRASRNLACALPGGANVLFPARTLASQFGRQDAEYAWSVFLNHWRLLRAAKCDFDLDRVLEVGPGRNLGSALLWWCLLSAVRGQPVDVVCWDLFRNAHPEVEGFYEKLGGQLLAHVADRNLDRLAVDSVLPRLQAVSERRLTPRIHYEVGSLEALVGMTPFDLVMSQAAIEHVWHINTFWDQMRALTAPGGWHSHLIDMADHGRRETNYIELLEWSPTAYWLSMRFVPGAMNRWRACHHIEKLKSLGMEIITQERGQRERLPIPLHRVSRAFRHIGEEELRTTKLAVVARLAHPSSEPRR